MKVLCKLLKMIERIILHADWLLNLVNSDEETFKESILKSTEDEITSLVNCLRLSSNNKVMNSILRVVKAQGFNNEKIKSILVKHKDSVTLVLVKVLHRLSKETVQHVLCPC